MEKSSNILWGRKFKNSIILEHKVSILAVEKEQIIEWIRVQNYLMIIRFTKILFEAI